MPFGHGEKLRAKAKEMHAAPETGFSVTSLGAAGLFAGWILVALASLMVDSTLSPRFLDLPLGALLASQGAVLGLVVVGVRVARSKR